VPYQYGTPYTLTFVKRVLVTGGLGYVGSATTQAFASDGYECLVIDKKIGLNALNLFTLIGFCRRYKPDVVVHLSAKKSVGESIKHPAQYYLNNVGSTLAVSMASALFNLPVVFASSAAIYSPTSPYAKAKLIEEKIVSNLRRYVVLRYFNIGGQDEDIKDDKSTNIFSIINSAIRADKPFFINNKETTRDYVHVKDIADANLKAAEHLLKWGSNLTTDICSMDQHTVDEIVNIYRANSIAIKVEYKNQEDVTVLPSNFRPESIGWKPTYSFKDIVQSEVWAILQP
jgi:UDP-arabinose 4-epimerase